METMKGMFRDAIRTAMEADLREKLGLEPDIIHYWMTLQPL